MNRRKIVGVLFHAPGPPSSLATRWASMSVKWRGGRAPNKKKPPAYNLSTPMMRAINPPSFCTCAPPSLNSEKTLDGVDPANRQQQRASCVMLPLFLLSIYSFDSSLDRVSNRMCAPVRRARLCTPSLFFFLLQQTAPFFLLSFDTTSLSMPCVNLVCTREIDGAARRGERRANKTKQGADIM